MKKIQKKHCQHVKVAHRVWVQIIASVVTALVVLGLYVGVTQKPAEKMSGPKEYSEKELRQFWEVHLKELVQDGLFAGKHPVPDIQDRLQYLHREIQVRYKKYNVQLSVAHPTQTNAFAGCSFSNGVPNLVIFVRNCMSWYYQAQPVVDYSGTKEEAFATLVTSVVMHEFEHIVGDTPHGEIVDPVDKIAFEKRAWARTCEYTLRPLVEKQKAAISVSDQIYYTNWVLSGRNEDSPEWIAFIEDTYR